VDNRGTCKVVEAYLKYLYTEEAQDINGKHFSILKSAPVAKKIGRSIWESNLVQD